MKRYENSNIFTLTDALAQGQRVIIGVDSGELWNQGIEETLEDQTQIAPDHALIVSGIDTTDPNNVKVVLTDPGTGDVAKEYPIEQFIDAWQDSNFYMVSTAEPAPLAFNPEMVNFNYSLGHLPEIGGLPYEEFQQFAAPFLELDLSDAMLQDQAKLLSEEVYGEEIHFDSLPNLDELTVNYGSEQWSIDELLISENDHDTDSDLWHF